MWYFCRDFIDQTYIMALLLLVHFDFSVKYIILILVNQWEQKFGYVRDMV